VRLGAPAAARPPRPPARRRPGGPPLRRRDARLDPRTGGGPRPRRGARRPGRQRAPRGRGQPRADPLAAGRPPADRRAAGEPWLQYPALHALGEIGDPRAAPAVLRCSTTSCCAPPPSRPSAGWPAARRSGASCLTCSTPTPRCATPRSARWWRSSSGPPPPARASTPRCRPRSGARSWSPPLGMLADEDPRNRRTAAVTLGWLREPRAVAPLLELLGDPAVREFASHALVSIGSASGRPGSGPSPIPTTRCGSVRCAAWPGSLPPRAPRWWRPSSTTPRSRCGRRRRPRSAGWATRTPRCCSSSCSATRASSSRRARSTPSRG
jgi:hypothetical protein